MKDVEFSVDDASGNETIFKSFEKAAAFAVTLALSGKPDVMLDVLVYSRAGARALYGSEGVEMYEEDPEASVFERISIRASSQGRVP